MKRVISYILAASLAVGACTGGYFLYDKRRQANTYVEVFPVEDISTYDYGSSTNLSGVTINHQKQQVLLNASQKVEAVLVTEGQRVRIGDALIELDQTMTQLELEEMKIQLDKKLLEIQNAGVRLDKLLRTKPAGNNSGGGDPGWWDPWDPWDPWEEETSEEFSEEESSEEFSEEESSEEFSEEGSSEAFSEEESSEEFSEEGSSEAFPEEESPEDSIEETSLPEPDTQEPSPEETSSQEISPEETSSQEINPEETSSQEISPEETSSQEISPEETSSEETSPEQTSPEQTSPQETSPEQTSPQETSPEQTNPQETSPEQTSPQETSPEQTTSQETSSQETTAPEETTEESPTAADGQQLIGDEIQSVNQKFSGTGTKEDPFLFLCGANAKLSNVLVRYLIKHQQYAVFHFYNEQGIRDFDMDLSALILSEDGEPLIHTHEYLEVSRREPSCLAPGQITYQCEGCGDTYTSTFGEVAAHTNELILSRPANCIARGFDIYQCSVCGKMEVVYTPARTGEHSYVLVLDGGTTGKYHYYQCSICGESHTVENPNYIAPTQPAQPTQPVPPTQPVTEPGTSPVTAEPGTSAASASIRRASISHGRSMSAGMNLPSENQEDFSYMTADELAAEIASQRQTIRDLDLEYRKMELQYQKMEKEINGKAVIYSTVNGTVEQLQDLEEIDYNEPFLTINGAQGMYVRGTVGENMLEIFTPGLELSCSSWTQEGVISCTATVTEVSEYPSADMNGSSGNPNLSYYPFTAYIEKEECEGLQSGSWMDISLDTQGDASALCIEQMYVVQDANRYFVYVRNPETTLLEKRYVTIGKTLYDMYYEIKSGLSREDLIALPFGKAVKEGVKTKIRGEGSDDAPEDPTWYLEPGESYPDIFGDMDAIKKMELEALPEVE